MAYLLQCNGQEEEAADYYRCFQKTDFSTQPSYRGEIIPYLLATHRYSEALDLNEADFAHYARTFGNDTVNYNYLILLNRQAEAFQGLGQYQAACAWQRRVTVLQDSIHHHERREQAQELATAFRLNEKERQLEQARADMQRRTLLLGAAGLSFVLLLETCANPNGATNCLPNNWTNCKPNGKNCTRPSHTFLPPPRKLPTRTSPPMQTRMQSPLPSKKALRNTRTSCAWSSY